MLLFYLPMIFSESFYAFSCILQLYKVQLIIPCKIITLFTTLLVNLYHSFITGVSLSGKAGLQFSRKVLRLRITMLACLVAHFILFFHFADMFLVKLTCDTMQIFAAFKVTTCVIYQNNQLLVFSEKIVYLKW